MTTGHIPYFYADPSFVLTPDDARHFLTVLRGRDGDPLEVSDGAGRAWRAVARVGSRREVRAERLEERPPEPPPAAAIACAVPKAQRAGYLIEKSVEIGVSSLYLLATRFSSVKQTPPGLMRRFEAVAASAGMQSRRPWLPAIHPIEPLERFVASRGPLAVLDGTGSREGWERLETGSGWTLLVGPEGGWAPEEMELFKSNDLPLLALSSHPLRMETAAVTGLAFWYALKGAAGRRGG